MNICSSTNALQPGALINRRRPPSRPRPRNLFLIFLTLLVSAISSHGAFVYETPGEFLTSGDFNGDGILDVLVLDKATGNARVGYQDANGGLTWSAPLPTGVPAAQALAVGRFLTNGDAIAITSAELNRIHFVDLSNPSNSPPPSVFTPSGTGPNLLIGLASPSGTVGAFDSLIVGSGDNDPDLGVTLLEWLDLVGSALTSYQDSISQEQYLASGNSLRLGADPTTFAAVMQRGSNDQLFTYSVSNHFSVLLNRPGLPSGSSYAFGNFNNEDLPRFIFYVPGQSNILIQSLVPTNGGFIFDSGIEVVVDEPIQNVFYVQQGSDGSALLFFGDGIQGLTLPGGSPQLAGKYSSGAGNSGNAFTGVVPLTDGNFVLLDGPPGSSTGAHYQVIHFDGSTYAQLSAGNMSPVTSAGTRANVWLFQTEPFVTSAPGFIASVNAPDWSSDTGLTGGSLQVRVESDGGTAPGLGGPVTNNYGALPAGAAWATPEQYRDFISLFTYSSPRPPEAISISISPAPGLYGGPIQVSFSTLSGSDAVLYRAGTSDNWHTFTSPFDVQHDTTVLYYATNALNGTRSRLYSAAYSFGRGAVEPPLPPLDLAPGTSNPAPVFQTNSVVLSDIGTVFYGRRSATGHGTIWAINLDGSGETYITEGARPRVSRDGRFMAFLREGTPFNNQGNLWLRDLDTGAEGRLFINTNILVGYDWDLTETNLIFDFNNFFWRIGFDGVPAQLPLAASFNQGAPSVNPVDGSVAFHILYPGPTGLYLAPPDVSSKQALNLSAISPRWPTWAPDGHDIVFSDGLVSPNVDDGKNLWVLQLGPDYTNLYQITAFTDNSNGFPHGAVWSPESDALVGAGTMFNTNGIWMIPLTDDLTDCEGPPFLLPTSPGDPIDFVGSIVTAAAPPGVVVPGLFIRLDGDTLVVYWSSAYRDFTLESTPDLQPPVAWTQIPPPYFLNGYFYEMRQPLSGLVERQFYRLHYTGPIH